MSLPVGEYVAGTVAGFFTGMVGSAYVKVGSMKLLTSTTNFSTKTRLLASSAIGSTAVDAIAYFIGNSSPFWDGIKFGMGISASATYYTAGCEVTLEQIRQKPGGQDILQSEGFRTIFKQEIAKSALCSLVYSIGSRGLATFGFPLEPVINFQIGKWGINEAYINTLGTAQ